MALMLIGVAIYYTESMLRQGFTVRGVFIVLLAVCLAIHSLYVSMTWFVSGEYHDDFLTLWIVLTVLFLILLKKELAALRDTHGPLRSSVAPFTIPQELTSRLHRA